jgi:hypothetical protein
MTCASWEAFCEDLAAQALRHLAEHATDGSRLPEELKKSIKADPTRKNQHELAVWTLADDGWRAVLRTRAERLTHGDDQTLNTPKTGQLKAFFCAEAGLPDITACWYWAGSSREKTAKRLDDLVTLRGSIAHRRSPDGGVLKKHATDALELIQRLAAKSADAVSAFLEQHTDRPLPVLDAQGP